MFDQFLTPTLVAVVTITLMLSISIAYIVYLRDLERRGIRHKMKPAEKAIISGIIIINCSLGIFQWLHREIAVKHTPGGELMSQAFEFVCIAALCFIGVFVYLRIFVFPGRRPKPREE